MKSVKYILLVFIGFSLLTACKEEEEMNPSSPTEQDQILQDYFTKNNISPQKTASGLYYVVEKQGTTIQNGETIRVHYEGRLLSGQKFDSSFDRGEPIAFPVGVGQVIRGWDEGIPLIGKGGKGYLYIPSHLGYGARAAGNVIKPYSILVFRVEVVN